MVSAIGIAAISYQLFQPSAVSPAPSMAVAYSNMIKPTIIGHHHVLFHHRQRHHQKQ